MFALYTLCLSVLCLLTYAKPAEKCLKWGNQFDVPLDTKNIVFDCYKPDSRKVCCAAVNQTFDLTRGVGTDYERFIHNSDRDNIPKRVKGKCEVTKQYIPSPYELRDFQYAKDLELITDAAVKFDKLLTYVTADEMIANSTRWLSRIKVHMQSEVTPTPTPDDFEFLSRFHVTKVCRQDTGGETRSEWDEWIEPLSIHARHPFGFGRCRNTIKYYNQKPKTGRSDTDYVLLQSGMSLYNQSEGRRSGNRSRRNILLDAGTSTFDSSLFWFTCGYSQRKLSFDQVYAWEKTLLEPTDYWKRVPAAWKPFWHFFNVPISGDIAHADSPLRLIKSIATPQDFVSFKLDVDHPDTELPIALNILSDPRVSSLIDEFFFEFHFQCEVMTSCGWGKSIPKELHGFTLDRPHVLQFFRDLRDRGIRAHIWP